MIESLFVVDRLRQKHLTAPLFDQRERYLTHLFDLGTPREQLRRTASMLLHIVQLFNLNSSRPIDFNEVLGGGERWVKEANRRHRHSPYNFQRVARNWFRFEGTLIVAPQPAPRFSDLLSKYLENMRSQRGLASETLKMYKARLVTFLNWLELRCSEFSEVSAIDIDNYLQTKRSEGWSRPSLAAHSSSLKMFFRFAEQQRWCSGGIGASISRPRISHDTDHLIGPPWKEVRRLIDSIEGSKPADLRAKAMLLFLSIYGLRSTEVTSLKIEDIDWKKRSIIVRRAKRGKTQQFPLQSEVGEAIALYLERARPNCACRSLFVTLVPPFRPVTRGSLAIIYGSRTNRLGLPPRQFGPHMLRRACATELLRKRTSIQDIADFLGHSGLKTVSRYAKVGPASLRSVAGFSLRGIL